MRIVSYTDARNNLKQVMDDAVNDCTPIHITRTSDQKNCVLMSEDHYNSLMETVHLLSSPKNAERLLKSVDQIRQKTQLTPESLPSEKVNKETT